MGKADGEMRDVDADPCPAQPLRRRDRRPAAATRIENNVAFVRRCLNSAFEKRDGLQTGQTSRKGIVTSSPD